MWCACPCTPDNSNAVMTTAPPIITAEPARGNTEGAGAAVWLRCGRNAPPCLPRGRLGLWLGLRLATIKVRRRPCPLVRARLHTYGLPVTAQLLQRLDAELRDGNAHSAGDDVRCHAVHGLDGTYHVRLAPSPPAAAW